MNESSFTLPVPGVVSLAEAEGQFLEVMLTEFSLSRDESGSMTLYVSFDDSTPAVRKRGLRDDIRRALPDFDNKARDLQAKLEKFYQGHEAETFDYNDESFPFRFCSGGAIPVVSLGGTEYYCLNWRDIRPVGWNLANGGGETRTELLYPDKIISRELREEMLVFFPNPKNNTAARGQLSLDDGIDHPDPDLVWGLWTTKLSRQFQWDGREIVPVMPLTLGNDKLVIQFADHPCLRINNIAININALDNGIEVDRMVKISLPGDAVICDGEILSGHLLNSVMGLFEVNRFNQDLREGVTRFLPDRFFFDGQSWSGRSALDRARKDFIANKRKHSLLTGHDDQDLEAAIEAGLEFDLCPATRTALRRCLRALPGQNLSGPAVPANPRDVFLSFASEDMEHAKRAADFLKLKGFEPFFSADYREGSDFGTAINQALAGARCFVAVTSKIDHLDKRWLKYESGTFKILYNRGDKPVDLFFTVAIGINPNHLPPPYCAGTAIPCADDASMEDALHRIVEFLQRPKV
jgi:hypothetical protein